MFLQKIFLWWKNNYSLIFSSQNLFSCSCALFIDFQLEDDRKLHACMFTNGLHRVYRQPYSFTTINTDHYHTLIDIDSFSGFVTILFVIYLLLNYLYKHVKGWMLQWNHNRAYNSPIYLHKIRHWCITVFRNYHLDMQTLFLYHNIYEKAYKPNM